MVSIKETFFSFCSKTSLHGWQFLGQHAKGSEKNWQFVFWFVSVVTSLTFGIGCMMFHVCKYYNATPITSLDNVTIPLSEIYFPSVSVCNINQVRLSYFEDLGNEVKPEFIDQLYHTYIEGKTINASAFNNTREELKVLNKLDERFETIQEYPFSWDTHQKCKNMLLFSTWNGSVWDAADYEWDMEMDYGICCYYSPQLNTTKMKDDEGRQGHLDWGRLYREMPKGAPMGKDNGYSMLFDIEIFDYGYRNEPSEGLKMELVKHYEVPMMRQTGFHLAPGTENQVAITSLQMFTSDAALKRFSPDKRNCYTEDESILRYLPSSDGYNYSLNNCLFEAAMEHIFEKCKCYPRKFIYMTNHSQDTMGLQNCYGHGLECMNDEIKLLGIFNYVKWNGIKKKCRPNCDEQTNSMVITSSLYPNGRAFVYRNEFCILSRSLVDKCNSSKRRPLEKMYPNLCDVLKPLSQIDLDQTCSKYHWPRIRSTMFNCTLEACPIEDLIVKYARENLIVANVFMKSPFVTRFLKDQKDDIIDYVARAGGLLGLTMGFSIVSCFEIIFYLLSVILIGLSFPPYNKTKRSRFSKTMIK